MALMAPDSPSEPQFKTLGQYLQYLLDSREWTQLVLSVVSGIDKTTVSKIISDQRPITADMALILAEVFEVEAERFLELQKSWELAQARLKSIPDPGRSNRAYIFANLPVSEMNERGWIEAPNVRDVAKVESELARFFDARADQIEILPHAAKKTHVTGGATPAQLAWLYRVRHIASEMLVQKYSPAGERKLMEELRGLRISAEGVRKVPRLMAESGIRFVIVETLPSAKIDGVCFWLNESSPVIGLSMRYDRIDNFWFVLAHELEHMIQRHGIGEVMLDAELEGDKAGVGDTVPEEERIANQAAAEFCTPKKTIDSFIARKGPFLSERDLLGIARTLQIHPGLVVGQVQRRTGRYQLFRDHLAKVRDCIIPSATVDGWGDVYPLGI